MTDAANSGSQRENKERPRFRPLESGTDFVAAAFAAFAIYVAGFGIFDTIIVYGTTVCLGAVWTFLSLASRSPGTFSPMRWFNIVLGIAFAALILRWMSIMLVQEEFFVDISENDFMLAWAAFALIAYLTQRSFGWPMVAVLLALIVYAVLPFGFGPRLDWSSVADRQWFTTDGVFGRPVQVVTTVVLIFVVFGAVMSNSGAGSVLLKIAFALTGRIVGGPAHAAIVGSAMFGTMSGAAVANVVSTGVFTIPIIKRAGFKAKFAGAVEAAASTGGQIMPPVMGVVAFIMADVTGIPYIQIIVAALLPALFFYGSLFTVVLVEARKLGVGATPPEEREKVSRKEWIQSLAFWVPLAVIIAVLLTGRTPQNAGFYALISAFVMSLALFPEFRKPRKWWNALVDAGRTASKLMVIVASIGIVIGIINMTGIGLSFADAIRSASGSSLFFALLLVMAGCLIMGMGVPSVSAYLLLALIMGPVLETLGISKISAHMFMLYFGVLSAITPPVALAAFAAAPIAGAKPMETGFEAVRLSLVGFIIPFVFVYRPEILLIDGFELGGLALAVVAVICATWGLATGISRFELRALGLAESGVRTVAAVAAFAPDAWISISGCAVVAGLSIMHRLRRTAEDPA